MWVGFIYRVQRTLFCRKLEKKGKKNKKGEVWKGNKFFVSGTVCWLNDTLRTTTRPIISAKITASIYWGVTFSWPVLTGCSIKSRPPSLSNYPFQTIFPTIFRISESLYVLSLHIGKAYFGRFCQKFQKVLEKWFKRGKFFKGRWGHFLPSTL